MKTAVIIGATQGLGMHLATGLARRGWHTVTTGRRSPDDIDPAVATDYVQIDLSAPAAAGQLTELLAERRPDLIVHNAVSYGEGGDGGGLPELESLFRVNALAPYQALRDHLAGISDDRFCTCIVVNSDSIYHASRQTSTYAASKAALRVLTTALANSCPSGASVSTLLLGPLADPKKVTELSRVAERRGVSEEEITRLFLKRSNPSFVIDFLIDFESCLQSVEYIAGLGRVANGMLCRLDGGSAGSLV